VTCEKTGQELVLVPAGEFTMGARGREWDEGPPRKVRVDSFYVDRNEVTWRLYKKFCEATGRKLPQAPPWGTPDDHPVVGVSWHDAKAYCAWAGLSLPTEAQWEKAARGQDGRTYPWGKAEPAASKCNYRRRVGKTMPVGKYPGGRSPYGCNDMAANVWEWCADWHDQKFYESGTKTNPKGPPTGRYRIIRGGSWTSGAEDVRTTLRGKADPKGRMVNLGFRCAVTLK
jgi:serine/threonine-protein kinase